MQSLGAYGMIQSPEGEITKVKDQQSDFLFISGSYYSTGREDDSTGGNYGMMTSKSDLGTLDDSETSLCELDDGGILRPNSTGGVPGTPIGGNFGPMMSPLELTCLTGGQTMFSPTGNGGPPHLQSGAMMIPFAGQLPSQLGQNSHQHLLSTSSSASESSLTPIDKLYSMQNSYFNSSSSGGGGNPQEQECL